MRTRHLPITYIDGGSSPDEVITLANIVKEVYPDAYFGLDTEGEYEDTAYYPVFFNEFEETELDKSIELLDDILRSVSRKFKNITRWKTIVKSDTPITNGELLDLYERYKDNNPRLSSNGKIFEVQISEEDYNKLRAEINEEVIKASDNLSNALKLQQEQDESRVLWFEEE